MSTIYINHKLLLVSTDKLSKIHCKNGTINCFTHELYENEFVGNKYNSFHLYVISDETPKNGDFYLDLALINSELITPRQILSGIDRIDINCKKIVASTDPLKAIVGEKIIDVYTDTLEPIYETVPQIPESFVSFYIKEYNKGNKIDNIEVEYTESSTCFMCDQDDKDGSMAFFPYTYINVNKDNIISIK